MTASPDVIPSVSEESALGNEAGDGGSLGEIPRRCRSVGMTASPDVIPSVSEESALENEAGDGGILGEIPRRCRSVGMTGGKASG